MISENQTKNANYLRIICILKSMRDNQTITAKEYARAKKYYGDLTGADIIIAD